MRTLPILEEHLELFNEISKEITGSSGSAYIENPDFLNVRSNSEIVTLFNNERV